MEDDAIGQGGDQRIAGVGLSLAVASDGERCVIHVGGELDIATRGEFRDACVQEGNAIIVLDFGSLTFMDCGGYTGLIQVLQFAGSGGRTVSVRNATNQPGRLLDKIATLSPGSFAPFGRDNLPEQLGAV